jgi:aryl-alcohol dehydrogenase-like predicted oxidoreductase
MYALPADVIQNPTFRLVPLSVQVILNAFRRKPIDQVLPAAAAGVGIMARVPLACGLLSGR